MGRVVRCEVLVVSSAMLRRLPIVQSMCCRRRGMVVVRSGDAEVFASSGCFNEGTNGGQADTVKRVSICVSSVVSNVNPLDLLVWLLSTTAFVEAQVLHVMKVHDCCRCCIVIQVKRLEDRLDGCLSEALSSERLRVGVMNRQAQTNRKKPTKCVKGAAQQIREKHNRVWWSLMR